MKVWWVLAWEKYYPDEGLNNVHSTWATAEEAEREAVRVSSSRNYSSVEVENVSKLLGL